MNRTLIAVSGLVALSAIALGAQQLTLTRTLTANSTETYKVDTTSDMTVAVQSASLPLNLKTAMTVQVKTNDVDSTKGTGNVEVTTTVDKVDAGDGLLAQLLTGKAAKPIVQKGTVDKMGRFTLDSPADADKLATAISGAQNATISTLLVALPDHPVKVGDTWDITVPKGQFTGTTDQKLTAKLTGDKQVDGHDAWVISVTGDLKIEFDSDNVPKDDPAAAPLLKTHIVVKGDSDMTGEALVDKATGQTLSNDSTAKVKIVLAAPDAGMTGTGEGSATCKLKVEPAGS